MKQSRKADMITSIVSIIVFVVLFSVFYGTIRNKDNKESEQVISFEEKQEKSIYVESLQTYYLDQDKVLWLWGSMSYGKLEPGMIKVQNVPLRFLEDVEHFYRGHDHYAAVKTDGSLWLWGNNIAGELGAGTFDGSVTPLKVMEQVSFVDLGILISAAITEDGSLWTWGLNKYGYVGDGTMEDRNTPTKIMEDVTYVSVQDSCVALKRDGSLWTWGYAVGSSASEYEYICTPVKITENVQKVVWKDLIIKNDGTLYSWSIDKNANIHDGINEDEIHVDKILKKVKSVSVGYAFYGAIQTDGSLWMWGANENGQLGDGTTIEREKPVKVLEDIRSLYIDANTCAAISFEGDLWMWGENDFGQVSASYDDVLEPVKRLDKVKDIKMKDATCAALQEDGHLWMWGHNFDKHVIPKKIEDQDNPVSIFVDILDVETNGHSVAVLSENGLFMWGDNDYGELGNGTTISSSVPTEVIFEPMVTLGSE